jgi:hypothetical protein
MSITQGLSGLGKSLYAGWKGDADDDQLFFASFDGTKWGTAPALPGKSSVGPSLTELDGTLHAAWKGESGVSDQRLFHATFNGSKWSDKTSIDGTQGSSIGPALGVLVGVLYAVWKGPDGDESLSWSKFDGSKWSSPVQIPDAVSLTGPSLAAFGGKLWAAWRGSYGDQSVYHAAFDGSTWSKPSKIPGAESSTGASLAPFGSNLYAAWKGESLDQNLRYASFDGTEWSAATKIPKVGSSIGPTLAAFDQKLFAVWKGVSGDSSLWYTSFDGSSWSKPAAFPGNTDQDVVQPPESGLMGNSNYMIHGNARPLRNLSLTIEVTEDIALGTVIPNPPRTTATRGFSFQWNAYTEPTARCNFMQYNIGVNMDNPRETVVIGAVEYWPPYVPNGSDVCNTNVPLISIPGPVVPAGYTFTIALGADDDGIVKRVTFSVSDKSGKTAAQKPQVVELLDLKLDAMSEPQTDPQFVSESGKLTIDDLVPVLALELDIAGHDSGATAVLDSGAGNLTYSSSDNLTAATYQPAWSSAQGVGTLENANSFYGALPSKPSPTLTQPFGVNRADRHPTSIRTGALRELAWNA